MIAGRTDIRQMPHLLTVRISRPPGIVRWHYENCVLASDDAPMQDLEEETRNCE